MNDAQRSAGCVRFGAFEFDPQIGELLKHGLKIKLSGQPVELLAMLLTRPGQLVTREELCQGRSKTRPAGRSKNRPLRWWEGLICQDRQGGLERRPALPLGGAFRPERKVPLPIAASCRVG